MDSVRREVGPYIESFQDWTRYRDECFEFGEDKCCGESNSNESYHNYLVECFAEIEPPADPAMAERYSALRAELISRNLNIPDMESLGERIETLICDLNPPTPASDCLEELTLA